MKRADRKTLIRLASSLPKGSDARRSVLKRLAKADDKGLFWTAAGKEIPAQQHHDIVALNEKFSGALANAVHEAQDELSLNQSDQGLALWLHEGHQYGDLAKEMTKLLDKTLQNLAPLGKEMTKLLAEIKED
jgi:hypothetical protein